MDIETIYQQTWTEPGSHWQEYLKISGGVARIAIQVTPSGCRAVLSLWTLHGYQAFIALPEPDVRRQPLDQSRQQLLELAEAMLTPEAPP